MVDGVLSEATATRVDTSHKTVTRARFMVAVVCLGAVLFLCFYRLTSYPVIWFDEGSHLHVPKALVRYGVYADYSSDGFRYYGPTMSVGPSVLLPIAAAFRLFGVGLLQARIVMALYLLATICIFYRLSAGLGGHRLALAGTALLVSSSGTGLLEYGRQVLGEVPALCFLTAGLSIWFGNWERRDSRRLVVVGLLFGVALTTKWQTLPMLVSALGLAWVADLIYYRQAGHRTFLIPAAVAVGVFSIWQVITHFLLAPSGSSENLARLGEATASAALVFSPALMQSSLQQLIDFNIYLGWLPPALLYGLIVAMPRNHRGQQWGFLWLMALTNLTWYVVASIGWVRYAFYGLAISSLFVARLYADLTDGLRVDLRALWASLSRGKLTREAAAAIVLMLLIMSIVLPLRQVVDRLTHPASNAPAAMAAYLEENVPRDALIETWEQELGFLTDHNYHFPPTWLQNQAVRHVYFGAPSPGDAYTFVETASPDMVVIGNFARWVGFYDEAILKKRYRHVVSVGGYELYKLNR